MLSIQPKTAWKQAFNNKKVLGMETSDHQSNPTPSCNGVSPGTFLVSTGKVTDTSQDQIQKPGVWRGENCQVMLAGRKKDTYCRFKYPSIHQAVCYISICLSESIFLSFNLSLFYVSSLLPSFHCFVSILPSMQIETPGLEHASLNDMSL